MHTWELKVRDPLMNQLGRPLMGGGGTVFWEKMLGWSSAKVGQEPDAVQQLQRLPGSCCLSCRHTTSVLCLLSVCQVCLFRCFLRMCFVWLTFTPSFLFGADNTLHMTGTESNLGNIFYTIGTENIFYMTCTDNAVIFSISGTGNIYFFNLQWLYTRWFKYDRD